MIAAGEIEVLDEDHRAMATDDVSARIRRSAQGHPAVRGTSRRGDR